MKNPASPSAERRQRESLSRLMAAAKVRGVDGFFTPDMIESMDSDSTTKLLNTLLSRVNLDDAVHAKRKAVVAACLLVGAGVLVGCALSWLAFNPLRDVAASADKLEQRLGGVLERWEWTSRK